MTESSDRGVRAYPAGGGEWLDPPGIRHTEVDCWQARPRITRDDVGRRWRCDKCRRVFEAIDTGEQRDPYSWRQVGGDGPQAID